MSPGPAAAPQSTRGAHRSLTLKLLVFALGSFAFGFALVPLYDVLCSVTGVGDQKAAQHAPRMIGREGLGLAGVIRGRHATFDQTDLPPRVWLAAAAMAWSRRWQP